MEYVIQRITRASRGLDLNQLAGTLMRQVARNFVTHTHNILTSIHVNVEESEQIVSH